MKVKRFFLFFQGGRFCLEEFSHLGFVMNVISKCFIGFDKNDINERIKGTPYWKDFP